MKYLLLTISLFVSMSCYAQRDAERDTLVVDGKTYLIQDSFLKPFNGYMRLFKGNEVWLLDFPLTRGYTVTWIVKNGIVTFDHIKLKNSVGYGNTKKREAPHDIIKDPVTLDEIRKRLELLTNRKFNSDGLLIADWITGRFNAEANGHYVTMYESSRYVSDEHYLFTFEKGKLQSII